MVLTFTLNYGILMMKSLKQREQMADYNKDQMDRDERTRQYDQQMRYVETLGQFDDITKPEH